MRGLSFQSLREKKYTLIDLAALEFFVVLVVSLFFPGIARFASWEGSPIMNLARVKIIVENLPRIPEWNPYWYFGSPILRYYPPFFYYSMAILAWISNLSLLDAFRLYTYIIFSIGILSVYLLGKEIWLSRMGSFASAMLFLTASNIWIYWDVGSTENILAVLFAVPSLLLLFRSFKKPTLLNIVSFGMVVTTTYLTHLANALIFTIIIGFVCLAWLTLEHSVTFLIRLLKVMVPSVLIVLGISLFWYLPFFNQGGLSKFTALGLLSAPGASGGSSVFFSQLTYVLGFEFARNLWSPGFGHFLLGVAGCILAFGYGTERAKYVIIMAALFLVTFILCFSRWLYIPIGIPFRFSPYYSLFAALCGGYAVQRVSFKYLQVTRDKQMAVLISSLILIASIYPSIGSISTAYANRELETPEPDMLTWLKNHIGPGEWVITNDLFFEWRINLYTSIGQAGGCDLYARTNDFAYTYWYFIISKQDSRYLQYLSRNFNVRYLLFQRAPTNLTGIQEVYPRVYEVDGFNSSFVEVLGSNSLTVLFFGDKAEYARLFESVAPMNSSDIVLINGGEYVEDCSIDDLSRFDVIYLNGLRYRSISNLSELLSSFAERGGGIILDTGDFLFGGNMSGIPAPFPVSETSFTTLSFELAEAVPNNITAGINFTRFSVGAYDASSAKTLRSDSVILISDDGKPVLVFWKYGKGSVIWSGLRLPYHGLLYKNFEEMKLLESMIRNVTAIAKEKSHASASFEFPNADEIIVYVRNATYGNALWVKMSYYPGWAAYIGEKSLDMFLAGPNMMMVLPGLNGDYSVRFRFEKTFDVQIGEAVSIISVIALLVVITYDLVKAWRRKRRVAKQEALW